MEKKLIDYIHFYLGGQCILFQADGASPRLLPIDVLLIQIVISGADFPVKILLRPMSDITQDEASRIENLLPGWNFEVETDTLNNAPLLDSAILIKELIGMKLDVFGLIQAGIGFDSTTKINQLCTNS